MMNDFGNVRQRERLQSLLATLLGRNAFYRSKLHAAGLAGAGDVVDFAAYHGLPLTVKTELSEDQAARPPFGTNLSEPIDAYTRVHQTSGTKGEPLRWLDTEASWAWWGRCWATVFSAAGIGPADRIFFPFSFGPFIGFWSAFEGARALGALAIPGGGMSSIQRLEAIARHEPTVVVSTPTYAIHLAEVAQQSGFDLAASSVRATIHAGEPGASIAATRRRLEAAWGARCFDHAGATEVGAWGYQCVDGSVMHVNEEEFIVEVVDPDTLAPARSGELVITNLGRSAMPVLRYRTGDKVTLCEDACACGRSGTRLLNGVEGRLDDVLIVRGVNIYPSAVEELVRRIPAITEFAIDVRRSGSLDEVGLRVEVGNPQARRVADELEASLRSALGLRIAVQVVESGTLERFELKARRVHDLRET